MAKNSREDAIRRRTGMLFLPCLLMEQNDGQKSF